MADAGRRFTIQPPNTDLRSGIPVPMSTAKKPGSSMRLSTAGPALRGLHPPNAMAPPSTNPRQSMYRSQNMNPLLASASKPSFGRTPLASARRGSMWGGGMPPPPTSQVIKDVRPLREPQFQSKMRQDVYNCLRSTSYDISMRTLTSITGRDYRGIFNHLVLMLDGNYPFDPNLKFEDEFMTALKALRYPFVGQLKPIWLAAPASMDSWPALLGVLHWLAMLCKGRLNYLESMHWTLLDSSEVPEEFDDDHHHRTLAFEHCSEAYEVFLSGVDDYSTQERALEARYKKKNERVIQELEEQKTLLREAQLEYTKALSEAAPLEKLKKTNQSLRRDREKFQEVIMRWEMRKSKLLDYIAQERAELALRANYLEELKTEQGKLSDIVKEQNLSPEEVIRMNTEHEQLSRNLEDLRHKIAESNKLILSLEVTVANRGSAAEEAIDAYTNLLSTLGLFPPLPPPYEDVDLTLELNTAASNPQQLLLGADLRRVIKPTLSGVAESKRLERAGLESERIKVDNELDQLVLECENLEEEIHQIEKKVVALNEQAEDLREAVQQEAHVSNAEATRLERELAQARTAALANGVGVKSRLQGLQIAYREQVEKTARLKDETVRAIVKNSSEIAVFKESISQQLKDLRDFAEAN